MKKHLLISITLAVAIFTHKIGYAVPILPLQFNPASLQFGIVTLGDTTDFLTVSLRLRDPAAPFGPMRIQLSDPNHFQIVSDSCSGAILTDAATCEVSASFNPDLFGHYSSFLVVLDEAGALGNFIPLEGIGADSGFTGPPGPVAGDTTVSSSTDELVFGSQTPGIISEPHSLTLINTGSGDLRVAATTFGGDAPFNFARIDTCMPQLVVPGGTCAITAFFKPISNDPAAAALAITANIADSPLVVGLSGNGALSPSGGGCALGSGEAPPFLNAPWIGFYSLLVLAWIRRLK